MGNNIVLATALQICSGSGEVEVSPEIVFWGYARLLSMSPGQAVSLIGDEENDLEKACAWFSKHKINSRLVKDGMKILITLLIRDTDEEKKRKTFEDYLNKKKTLSSSEILDKALECATIPMAEIFAEGQNLSSVLNYHMTLKKAFSEKKALEEKADKKDEKTAEKKTALSGKKVTKTENSEKEKEFTSGDNLEKPGNIDIKKETSVDNKKDSEDAGSDEPRNLDDLADRINALSAALLENIKGQDQAVLKFLRGYSQGELLRQSDKGNHPRSYFFFFGPPGVGKTMLAETAAAALGIPCKPFNMADYANPSLMEDFLGSSNILMGKKESGLLGYVKKNPECLLIFDEFEKASIYIIRLFLQILGSGKLHDRTTDKDVSFKDTTIIFTSNVGKSLYDDRSVNLSLLPDKLLIEAIGAEENIMGKVIPPEMCSRIASGNVILFNHLPINILADMARSNFDRFVIGMEKEYGIKITYDKALPLLFLYNRGSEIDARIATGQSSSFITTEIFELLRQMGKKKGQAAIKTINLKIDWSGMHPELIGLFKNETKTEIMAFTGGNDSVFDGIDKDRFGVTCANTIEEAEKLLQSDVTVALINPFGGKKGKGNQSILSISDYNTDGVSLFHKMAEKQAGIPIYLLEIGGKWSEIDRRTFMQEGAYGTIKVNKTHPESFHRQLEEIAEELYMEKENQVFTQRGLVLDFNTKQEIVGDSDEVNIVYYDIKKRVAMDLSARNSVLSEMEKPKIGFDDIIGASTAKEKLKYFAQYLMKPKQFMMTNGRAPRGVLLYGPPGTGKTMLAKAMAGEADVAFFQLSATEFMSKWFGESEERIRDLFKMAHKYAPAIIFIDEVDAIGKARTGGESSEATEKLLNQLLTEMGGFSTGDPLKPVFVLAATNFGAREQEDGDLPGLDKAFVRRFDETVYVPLPKNEERAEYIRRMLKKRNVTTVSGKTIQNLANRTPAMSLAILENIMESAFRTAFKASRELTEDDLLTALEDYVYGEKREHSEEYYKRVAIHETGHAFVSYLGGVKPTYITIESRGDFGGYMQPAEKEDGGYTKEEILARIRTSLAGRAAEEVFFGKEVSLNTGASQDLMNATNCAFALLCSYGMGENRLVVLRKDEVLKSGMAQDYINQVNEILNGEMKKTLELIQANKKIISSLADELLKENRLTGDEFEKLMESGREFIVQV